MLNSRGMGWGGQGWGWLFEKKKGWGKKDFGVCGGLGGKKNGQTKKKGGGSGGGRGGDPETTGHGDPTTRSLDPPGGNARS